jgi:putative flippase GtrA
MVVLRTAGHTAPRAHVIHRQAVGATSSYPDGRAATRHLPDGISRELLVFGAIGVVSTAAYAVLYLALRPLADPVIANALALLLTAIGNTAANRRLTFGIRGRRSMVRDQVGGLIALAVALAITTAAVSMLAVAVPTAGRVLELAVLVAANAAATVVRFVLLRALITADRERVAQPNPVPANPWSRS